MIEKTSEFGPDGEKWLYEGDEVQRLEKALEWAQNHAPPEEGAPSLRMMIKLNQDLSEIYRQMYLQAEEDKSFYETRFWVMGIVALISWGFSLMIVSF